MPAPAAIAEALPSMLDGRTLVSQASGQYLGVGNNSELHQETILAIAIYLKSKGWRALPEVPIQADKKRMPDVVVYDNLKTSIVAIEVVDGPGWRADKAKVHAMVDAGKGLLEGFVYECRKGLWYSTTGMPNLSYSLTLGVDLAEGIK